MIRSSEEGEWLRLEESKKPIVHGYQHIGNKSETLLRASPHVETEGNSTGPKIPTSSTITMLTLLSIFEIICCKSAIF